MCNIKTIKPLLVDDHLMFTDGLKSILNLNAEIGTIFNATSAEEAYELLKKDTFDIVITDISLPGMNGIELIKKIKKQDPNIPVLVLSMYVGRELVKEILFAEAEGYLLKKAGKEDLFIAIDKIVNGGTYYGSEVASVMKDIINDQQLNPMNATHELTPREREILQLICQEYSSKEIADKLCIGISTVETHRRSMFQKTNSKSVVGLIRYAVANNLALWP